MNKPTSIRVESRADTSDRRQQYLKHVKKEEMIVSTQRKLLFHNLTFILWHELRQALRPSSVEFPLPRVERLADEAVPYPQNFRVASHLVDQVTNYFQAYPNHRTSHLLDFGSAAVPQVPIRKPLLDFLSGFPS